MLPLKEVDCILNEGVRQHRGGGSAGASDAWHPLNLATGARHPSYDSPRAAHERSFKDKIQLVAF